MKRGEVYEVSGSILLLVLEGVGRGRESKGCHVEGSLWCEKVVTLSILWVAVLWGWGWDLGCYFGFWNH